VRQPVIELPDEQQPRVARDLAAVEGGRDLPLESEAESTMRLCSHPRQRCSMLASITASVTHFRGVGGFFTPSGVNSCGNHGACIDVVAGPVHLGISRRLLN